MQASSLHKTNLTNGLPLGNLGVQGCGNGLGLSHPVGALGHGACQLAVGLAVEVGRLEGDSLVKHVACLRRTTIPHGASIVHLTP